MFLCGLCSLMRPYVSALAGGRQGRAGGSWGGANTRRHVAAWTPAPCFGWRVMESSGAWTGFTPGPASLMAFQVWGCHLSGWLMSMPWESISFRHPSLLHQREKVRRSWEKKGWATATLGIKLRHERRRSLNSFKPADSREKACGAFWGIQGRGDQKKKKTWQSWFGT